MNDSDKKRLPGCISKQIINDICIDELIRGGFADETTVLLLWPYLGKKTDRIPQIAKTQSFNFECV